MSIVEYTDRKAARIQYPRRIVSPLTSSACCVEGNRQRVGGTEVEEGETFFYKRCRVCGHTVRFFFRPRTQATRLEIEIMRERASATLH